MGAVGCRRWEREKNENSPWWPFPLQKSMTSVQSASGLRGQLNIEYQVHQLRFPKGLFQRCIWTGPGASCSYDGSWSSWHRDCGFQEKPQRTGASRVGMSLKLKPLGICALRRRPEATGLSKVNAIPSMGTACSSDPGASLKLWFWSLRHELQESSKAKMIFIVMW